MTKTRAMLLILLSYLGMAALVYLALFLYGRWVG